VQEVQSPSLNIKRFAKFSDLPHKQCFPSKIKVVYTKHARIRSIERKIPLPMYLDIDTNYVYDVVCDGNKVIEFTVGMEIGKIRYYYPVVVKNDNDRVCVTVFKKLRVKK
jgi:hypothetical protein